MQHWLTRMLSVQDHFFTWSFFVVLAVLYTVMLFTGMGWGSTKNSILLKKPPKALSQILLVHLSCLTLLAGAFVLAPCVSLYLPDWITLEWIHWRSSEMYSYFDFMFLIAMGLMLIVERKWLWDDVDAW